MLSTWDTKEYLPPEQEINKTLGDLKIRMRDIKDQMDAITARYNKEIQQLAMAMDNCERSYENWIRVQERLKNESH